MATIKEDQALINECQDTDTLPRRLPIAPLPPIPVRGDVAQASFLTRKEAATYLLQKYGAPGAVAASTLSKLAVVGGGPIRHSFGRKVGYLKQNLDAWVSTRCLEQRSDT